MAQFCTTLSSPLPIDTAFAYMADFTNVADWDPDVVEATKLTRGPVAAGTVFHVETRFIGSRIEIPYRVVAFEPPTRVVFRGATSTVTSTDEITLTPHRGGTQVVYDARLELPGVLAVADRLLEWAFRLVGARAAAGLRKALRCDPAKAGRDDVYDTQSFPAEPEWRTGNMSGLRRLHVTD